MPAISTTKLFMEFFGKREGQTTAEFAAELKALSDEAKKELGELCLAEMIRTGRLPADTTIGAPQVAQA